MMQSAQRPLLGVGRAPRRRNRDRVKQIDPLCSRLERGVVEGGPSPRDE
jgi:hypothetical protein